MSREMNKETNKEDREREVLKVEAERAEAAKVEVEKDSVAVTVEAVQQSVVKDLSRRDNKQQRTVRLEKKIRTCQLLVRI